MEAYYHGYFDSASEKALGPLSATAEDGDDG